MAERGPTLLVIEDARDQALLVGIAARRAHPGLDVRIAHDGAEGIAYLGGFPSVQDGAPNPTPDLVLLDLYMPELDGFGVLEWVRAHLDPAPCPIVVLTASVRPEDAARALDLGAAAVHSKPGDLHGLGEVVKEIVHKWIGRGEIIGAHIWQEG